MGNSKWVSNGVGANGPQSPAQRINFGHCDSPLRHHGAVATAVAEQLLPSCSCRFAEATRSDNRCGNVAVTTSLWHIALATSLWHIASALRFGLAAAPTLAGAGTRRSRRNFNRSHEHI
jgi:hypothetical protein